MTIKNWQRTAKSFLTWGLNQNYCPGVNWRTCMGEFVHLKPASGCPIPTLIFEFFYWEGTLSISHEKLATGGKVLSHLGFKSKAFSGLLSDLSAWLGFSLMSTAGCEISTLIYGFIWGILLISNEKLTMKAKFFFIWELSQRYCPGL